MGELFMIIDKLISKIQEMQSPIVVGLDPRLSQIPDHIKEPIYAEKGKTPGAAASAIFSFNIAIINSIYDIVPAIKPQIAMYEQFGPEGIACYKETVAYAKSKGLIVIGDIKRGDIASTAEAYSDAHIGKTDVDGEETPIFDTDFITVNPYLGFDSIDPYLTDCEIYNKGLFVLVKTSNESSSQIQNLQIADGRPVYAHVGELVDHWGRGLIGKHGFSSIGAVVGATHPAEGQELRELLPRTFFLVPGYGAQGGKAADLCGMLNKDGLGIIVNNSRGITGAYQSQKYKSNDEDFAEAARAAALDMKADLDVNM